MIKPGEFLDYDILARGGKIEDDAPSNPVGAPSIPPAQPTIYPPDNPMQFAPQFPPMPPVEVTGKDTYEPEEVYSFWEDTDACEIHVTIGKSSQSNGVKSNRLTHDSQAKRKDICIARFLIVDITKEVFDGLEQNVVQFVIQCKYYDESARKERNLKLTIPEDTLHSDKLIAFIKKAFDSQHTPFPPKVNKDCGAYLSAYILKKFHHSPKTEYIPPTPILNRISSMSDPERKFAVDRFYKIYHNTSCEMVLLLSSGFGAILGDKAYYLIRETGLPCIEKVIVVYGCKSSEHQKYIVALASTSSNPNTIRKLSEIKVSAWQDELKEIFFKNQFQTVFFVDDGLNDYSKKRNIEKIQRISEYVSNGIVKQNDSNIPCTAIVFTARKITEFQGFAHDCFFIDANNLPEQNCVADIMQTIVTNFLSLLYENADYNFRHKAKFFHRILNASAKTDISYRNTVSLCEVYRFMAKLMFENYGIGDSEENMSLQNCSGKTMSEFLHENSLVLSHDKIITDFANEINRLIQNKTIQVQIYDKSLTAVNQALLYEHIGEPVLLFSNKYFEELFVSPVVGEKALREILNEYGYVVANYSEKCNFRMPIDERKLYVAVKVSILNEQSKQLLPDLHPIFTPDLNDGIDRIFLANDVHGKPIYWPVGKIENRSVLVQGNTRMGKTYFTTTRLIMGLHKLGYRVVIFDSAASSYSHYELSKCGFDKNFILANFCHGKADEANAIMSEFQNESDKIYIVNNVTNDVEKEILCDLLFKYQNNEFNANLKNTQPLFIVFEEAGDSTLYDTPELKRIYNQGSKLRLSVITILQMFIGEGSQRFRRMVGQASLKVSYKCSTDHIRYFLEVIPHELKATAKAQLPMLGIGEAIICGDFEDTDGSLYTGGFITRKN